MALAYLVGSVTQGGADAFAQAEVPTALTGQTRRAYRLRELLFELTPTLPNVDTSNIQLCLTRRSKAAMPNITDRDVLAKVSEGMQLVTSGAILINGVKRIVYGEDDEVIIVEDPIYFSIDSDSTSATSTAYVRIGYEEVNISEVDRLQLLTQSLQP